MNIVIQSILVGLGFALTVTVALVAGSIALNDWSKLTDGLIFPFGVGAISFWLYLTASICSLKGADKQ